MQWDAKRREVKRRGRRVMKRKVECECECDINGECGRADGMSG